MTPRPSHTADAQTHLAVVQPRRGLLTRDFTYVWWGQMVSEISDGVTKLALLWFVYSITGSAMKTSVIGLLQTLPPILFGPIIGVYLDRLPKKPILIGTAVLRAVLIGLIPCLLSAEAFTLAPLYALVSLHAVATAVFGPALTASVPLLVPRTRYTAANGLLQSTTSLGIIVGPALSGMGIAAFSSQEVLCVNAVTYLTSAACFVPVRFPGVRSRSKAPRWSVFHDLLEGFRFTLGRQPVILVLIITAGIHTFGTSAFSTLFPVFGRQLLDLGPMEVGYLWSSFGVGLLAVSLTLIPVSGWDTTKRVRVIAVSCFIAAPALSGLAWVAEPQMATVLMIIIGASIGVFTPIAWAIVQELSPDHMLGRALTIYTMGAMVSAIIGMTVFGWVTEAMGPYVSILGLTGVLAIAGCAAAVFGWWVRHRPT